MRLNYQIKRGLQLIKMARGRDRVVLLHYPSLNLLHRILGIHVNSQEINVRLSDLNISTQTFSDELGAYLDIFFDTVYEYLPNFVACSGQTIIDVGANIGFYTLRQAAAVGPTG